MGPAATLTIRWTAISVCSVIAFWPGIDRTFDDFAAGGLLGYMFLKPLMAIAAAIGIARRRDDKVHVHDRESDTIVGALTMAVAVAVSWLLVPRTGVNFELLRVDMLGFWVFVFGACTLLFGLRSTGRYWPIWLMVMALWPGPYRTAVTLLGGGWLAAGIVLLLFAATALGIAAARTIWWGLVGFTATLLIGGVIILFFDAADISGQVMQLVPAIVSGAVVGAVLVVRTVWVTPVNTVLRPTRPPIVQRPYKSALLVVAATFLLIVVADPPVVDFTPSDGPSAAGPLFGQDIPPGWKLYKTEQYDWCKPYFGDGCTLTRQRIVTTDVNPDWDDKGRRRYAVIDTLRTFEPQSLRVYPVEAMYDVTNGRQSPKVPLDLGAGVSADLCTVIDDDLLVTWTNLRFIWIRAGAYERVTVLTVDNHNPDAPFPDLRMSVENRALLAINVMLRGKEVVSDFNSQYKDRDLMTVLGNDLVDYQLDEVRS
ncbi:hypothetical protein OG921_02375 [Aldersonia sp. NBC_00410]|uniref:hypothetical protein n=1 Tax=Aldersonia sp. NBC_00410 TaxID=2975954 RepID=UPI00225394C1|nr:hypothetical protein [Aldersonia sp. NBC_00410]MCX5042041.1 hypothetical protein [Aldersonia sp. NBC_00410]